MDIIRITFVDKKLFKFFIWRDNLLFMEFFNPFLYLILNVILFYKNPFALLRFGYIKNNKPADVDFQADLGFRKMAFFTRIIERYLCPSCLKSNGNEATASNSTGENIFLYKSFESEGRQA